MFKNFIKVIIIFVVFMVVFSLLEYESSLAKLNSLIQPFLFAVTLSISISLPHFRKIQLFIAFLLLLAMVFTYLVNQINVSNWLGSLGFGILILTIFSYIPELIKKGYIERY